jgi:DNA repair ATPase RecN
LEHKEEALEPNLKQVYTIESLGNTLTWGDQQIPEPMDKVANIHAIAYDRKRKDIVQRTTKKRRITLDHSILITIEENLINIENSRTSKLISVGRAISDTILDKDKIDEKELAATLKELEQLHHLYKYYHDTTHAIVYLRSEFQEAYRKFTDE